MTWYHRVCISMVLLGIFSLMEYSNASVINLTEVVNTTFGPIRGEIVTLPTGKSVKKYLGIKYAKAKRFEDPTDPNTWSTVLNATGFGKHCPQPSRDPRDPNSNIGDSSEDCLFMNVFVPGEPAVGSGGFAVLLWIHGGAYVFGSSGISRYDGGVLAGEERVIVVTCNFRVGALGLLSTGSDDLRGNYGMLDQVYAMKWVNKNIQRFGGNPNNVTIFGESAGGMSVSLLMLSPLTTGLYRHAILQSGAAPALYTALLGNEAKERASMFADALGCSDISQLKQCALKKSVAEIILAQVKVKSAMMLSPFAPVVDGHFLTDSPVKIMERGDYQKRGSILIGVTRDEGSRFTGYIPGVIDALDVSKGLNQSAFKDIINKTQWIRGQNNQILKAITYQYSNWADLDNVNATRQSFLDVHADAAYKAPAILSAMIFARQNVDTYFYQLDYSASTDSNNRPIPAWKRVFHGADIQYVFGAPLINHPSNSNHTDVLFSKSIMAFWATFAKNGNPNPANQKPVWPLYTTATQQYMSLKPTMEVKSRLLARRMRFWNSYVQTLVSKATTIVKSNEKMEQKERVIIGLAVAVAVLGVIAIVLLIVVICTQRKTNSLNLKHQ